MTAPGGALVTGAGRGLGREIARVLATRGLAVHVTDADGASAEAVAAELGGGAWGSTLDVRDEQACRAAARATAERAGGLAVWVNNAGILRTGPGWAHDEAERRLMFDVNTHGTINGTVAALELMRPADRGHVLNVISLAGISPAPGETVYAATKHAALAFSLGTLLDLRRTGSRGVRLSCVCPDGIWTPMLFDRADDPEAWPSWSGTILAPEDVAARTVALLDRPRPLVTIPRWRGALLRTAAAAPSVFVRVLPLVIADARRRQRRWRDRHPVHAAAP